MVIHQLGEGVERADHRESGQAPDADLATYADEPNHLGRLSGHRCVAGEVCGDAARPDHERAVGAVDAVGAAEGEQPRSEPHQAHAEEGEKPSHDDRRDRHRTRGSQKASVGQEQREIGRRGEHRRDGDLLRLGDRGVLPDMAIDAQRHTEDDVDENGDRQHADQRRQEGGGNTTRIHEPKLESGQIGEADQEGIDDGEGEVGPKLGSAAGDPQPPMTRFRLL